MQAASARTYQGVYLPFGRSSAPSLLSGRISPYTVILSALRGAERHAITVVGVVVVAVAVVVDIAEVRGVAGIR